jgi:TRAP-type C4-dicarboxylate transport system permease small subunit
VLAKIEKHLIMLESCLAASSLLLLLLLSVFQMLLRNILNFGYPEIEILNRHLLLVCGAMGAVIATSQFRHIKIDALTPLLDKATNKRIAKPLLLFSAVVCTALCHPSIQFVIDEWQYAPANERWILPFTLIYPLGFSLLSVHFLILFFSKDHND